MSVTFVATGYLARSGNRYVLIACETGRAVLPLSFFHLSNTRLPAVLAKHGVPVLDKQDHKLLLDQVRQLDHFIEDCIIENVGWDGNRFATLGGSIIPEHEEPVHIVFKPDPRLVASKGSLKEWQEQVFGPAAKHPLVAVCMMAMLFPAIARFIPGAPNITLELVGEGGTGKSMAQLLAASVYGPPSAILSLSAVLRDVPAAAGRARDYPLIVDGAQAVVLKAGKKEKPGIYTAMAYDLPSEPGRRVVLVSGRNSLHAACDMECADDATITIPVPFGANGVFDVIPPPYQNGAQLADSLLAAAKANYGHAYPEFVLRLLTTPGLSPAKIKKRLARAQRLFLDAADAQAQPANRQVIIRALAAIYAAASLARSLGILPKNVFSKDAALTVLEACVRAKPIQLPFAERLEQLIESGELHTIEPGIEQATNAKAAAAAIGTVTNKPYGQIVKIPRSKILRAFPDWERIKTWHEVRTFLKVDGNNLAAWGKLYPGAERTRLYQFILPSAEGGDAPEPHDPTLFDEVDHTDG